MTARFAVLMGEPRDDEAEKLREAAVTGAVLSAGAGVCVLLVAALTSRWPIEGFYPERIAVAGVLALAMAATIYAVRERMTWFAVHAFLVVATVAISAGQILTAGGQSFAPMLLLWAILFSFWYLPQRQAFAHMAFALGGLCAIFALQPGWTNPTAYAVFLAGTFAVTAWAVMRLTRKAEAAAEQERRARLELAALNATLEHRVDEQVDELGRLARLRRFLSPSVADAVLTAEGEEWLTPHRAEIAAVFIDLRGFTTFSGTAEPEDVTQLLHRFHEVVGALVARYEATVGAFAGDGVLLYFNDPVPCADPAQRAVRLAMDLRAPMGTLATEWVRRGFDMGYGVGIAHGYATLGITGFDSRSDYTAIGTVINLASRLSDEAGRSEILLDARTAAIVAEEIEVEAVGEVVLKGFARPVPVHRVSA